jgi:phosphopantothenoylcysteine decarboxylase/phosphopantothenate--cysteine ligase
MSAKDRPAGGARARPARATKEAAKGLVAGRGRALPIARKVARTSELRRLRVVITAGPTREYIDPVRYLTNESSGRMGFAIAAAAARAGHEVVLIAGPVVLATPRGVRRIDVVSARDMLDATVREFRRADALFMAAAVADWRPASVHRGKWRKRVGVTRAALELVQNPDILERVSRSKAHRLVVGFALETSRGLSRARAKLKRKGADFIVLNDASALNARRSSVIILGGDGTCYRLTERTKPSIARSLVGLLAHAPRM